jgi:hypothetical protein
MKKKRLVAAVLLIGALSIFLWYQAMPRVPDGQAPLVNLDAASVASLREEFNRGVDRVRIIVVLAPT